MTEEEQEQVDFSRKVTRLADNKDFQDVILESYINGQALTLGTDFDGLDDEVDTLKAISHLKRWLRTSADNGKIILNTIKG